MNHNSGEAVNYIGLNMKKIIRQHSNRASFETIEDACQKLICYLLEEPRHIPNIPAWVRVSLHRYITRNNRYNKRFIYDTAEESVFSKIKDDFNLHEFVEKQNSVDTSFKKIEHLINNKLGSEQRASVINYLVNDGNSKDKIIFKKSINELRKIVDSPLHQCRKYNQEKMIIKRGYGLKKRGRKKGTKIEGAGRKSKITETQICEIKNMCKISNGYVINLNEISNKFKLSNTTISRVLKTQLPELNEKRRKSFSLEFLLVEAKKHNTRFGWQKAAPGQYKRARIMGWLDECCKHMSAK